MLADTLLTHPYVWPLREFLPLSTPAYGTPFRHTDFSVFHLFYFTAIVKGVIAFKVVCLKRRKQELLVELFCLDR